jgi:hypothetical protein
MGVPERLKLHASSYASNDDAAYPRGRIRLATDSVRVSESATLSAAGSPKICCERISLPTAGVLPSLVLDVISICGRMRTSVTV